MHHRFASTVLTCKYTGLLRAAQGIRRKFFGGHAKTAIPPRPGVVPPCKPAVDRPTLTDRKSAGLPVPPPTPTHNRSASQTVHPRVPRPSDRKHTPPRISAPDTPAFHFRFSASPDISGHWFPSPSRRTKNARTVSCAGVRLSDAGEISPPPVLFSAGITPRPLSWQRLSWPTWPRQPPWRSSERPVRRCRRASSSRPRR